MISATTIESKQKPRRHTVVAEEDESELITVAATGDNAFFDMASQLMEKFASTRIGQFVIERGDRVLCTFEETAKWSLPIDKSNSALKRPLPWLPFLLLIITLRQLRMWVSLASLMIGNEPVTAQHLIYFIQTRRRKLRSIRLHGLKAMQQRKPERTISSAIGQEAGIMVKLATFFSFGMCRSGYDCEPERRLIVTRDWGLQEVNQHNEATFSTQTELSEEEILVTGMNCAQLLSKYANENSDEDSDYVLNQDEDEASYKSTSTTSSTDMQGESGKYTSDENSKDQKITEKGGMRETVVKLSSTENTPTTNISDNDDSMKTMEKSGRATTPPPQMSNTSLENGPSNGGEAREAVEVGNFNHLNVLAEEQNKSTPGFENAAHSTPQISPPLFGNIVNAIDSDSKDSNDGIDAADDCVTKQTEIRNNLTQLPPLPSASCSTTSSNSSLVSFVTSDDCVVDDGRGLDLPTPTPSLHTTSSMEDIFLSPIGV